MRKRIFLLAIFIITFLCVSAITFAPGIKTPEIQRKPERNTDQLRLLNRIERQKQEKEEYLERRKGELRLKAESSNVELVGKWPYGPCRASDLDTVRNIAVIGNGETLQVLDISEPSSPFKIGEVILHEEPLEIVIAENYAFVLSRYSLKVVDISIPSSPNEVGNVDISGYVRNIAVQYPYLYVADTSQGLTIFDVSTPANPTQVGFYEPEPFDNVYDVAIWQNYAFIINTNYYGTGRIEELVIIDVSNPFTPALTGSCQLGADLSSVRIYASDTGYAYISQHSYSEQTSKLKIIDIATNPSQPVEVGNYTELDISFSDLVVSGNYAYIFASRFLTRYFLKVFDISNPETPFSIGEWNLANLYYSLDIDISGSTIGISHMGDGFGLYDVSDPNNLFHLGSYDTPSSVISLGNSSIVVSGDYAYIASSYDGLRIMDVSIPSDPIEVGICDTFYGTSVAVSGNYAYGVGAQVFWIVDISSPSVPIQVGHLDYSDSNWWFTWDVCISGNYAYVCGTQYVSDEYRASLDIIDVSDPSDLIITGSYICSNESYNWGGIALSGNYAYLPFEDNTGSGLKIIDISDPTNPAELGTYFSSDYWTSYDVEVRGNYAYLAGPNFRIIDVSNPSSPTEISSYPNYSFGIALSGNYAYLGYYGLDLIDISDPYNPVEAGYYYNSPYLKNSLAVSGNYAYVPGSLYILRNILAPEVSIASPSAWSEASGSVSIEAQASHSSGIAQVEFYIDDSFEATDTSSPYTYDWDTTSLEEGPHKIRARAYNNSGKSSDAEIEITVRNNMKLTISSGVGGTTEPEPGTYSYLIDSDVSVTALPDSGYRFSEWTGDVPSGHEEDNPLIITMDADKSIEANFIRQYTLTTAAGTGGTIDPSPGSYTYDTGTQVTVTATANTGYQFSSWSGDASGITNPITITMDEDKSITANFTQIPIDGGGDGDGDNGGGGGCFIATAAYSSPLHPHVDILRDFRDKYLMTNKFGRKLVGLYYKYSPFVAHLISEHKSLKVAAQINLMPLIIISYFIVHFGPVFTVVIFLLPILFVIYYQIRH